MKNMVQNGRNSKENIDTIMIGKILSLSEQNPIAFEIINSKVDDGWFKHHQTKKSIDNLADILIESCNPSQEGTSDED